MIRSESAGSGALEHLILRPQGGIGNRLQAIAAARRLCSLHGARCTVVWPEGNFDDLFTTDPGMSAVATPPRDPDAVRVRLPMSYEGGTRANRRVPTTVHPVVAVESCFFFAAAEEPLADETGEIAKWLPPPSVAVRDIVGAFREAYFQRTVGVHIRSGDNGARIVAPSLDPYVRQVARLVEEERTVLLATDGADVEAQMRERFGSAVITFPKRWNQAFRWPRHPDGDEMLVDFVDMQLLAACDYVIGWRGSSFSRIAAAYNGSARCQLMDGPRMHPVWGRYQEASRVGLRNTPRVISLATGEPPHPSHLARLRRSLADVGFTHEIVAWEQGELPRGSPRHEEVPFAFKPHCFRDSKRERVPVLWMDASCLVLQPIDSLFEQLRREGYVLFRNGRQRVGEWVSDATLDYFGMSRDEALEIPEVNAAVIGLHFSGRIGNDFLDQWLAAAAAVAPFRGTQEPTSFAATKHNHGACVSSDPRVRGHRHDQSVAAILAHRLGMRLNPPVGLRPWRPGSPPPSPDTLVIKDRSGTFAAS